MSAPAVFLGFRMEARMYFCSLLLTTISNDLSPSSCMVECITIDMVSPWIWAHRELLPIRQIAATHIKVFHLLVSVFMPNKGPNIKEAVE